MDIKFTFNRNRTTEAILYIAQNIPVATFLSINKLLYFADKTSLERYARSITGDTYFAMQNGPVPSNTYDLMKESPPAGEFGFRIENDHHLIPLRPANLDELSESDVECLDMIIELYGNVPVWKLIEDSHDEAWKEAWEHRENLSHPIQFEDILRLLDDGDALIAHLQSQNTD